ncbi:MAG: DUF4286 family protein [Bacteroidota bacterium]
MYLYNITYLVSHPINQAWLEWMKQEHVPSMLSSGLFTHHRIMRLMEVDQAEGITYAFQFYSESLSNYKKYITDFAPALRQKAQEKWGDQVMGFQTLMETVQ